MFEPDTACNQLSPYLSFAISRLPLANCVNCGHGATHEFHHKNVNWKELVPYFNICVLQVRDYTSKELMLDMLWRGHGLLRSGVNWHVNGTVNRHAADSHAPIACLFTVTFTPNLDNSWLGCSKWKCTVCIGRFTWGGRAGIENRSRHDNPAGLYSTVSGGSQCRSTELAMWSSEQLSTTGDIVSESLSYRSHQFVKGVDLCCPGWSCKK